MTAWGVLTHVESGADPAESIAHAIELACAAEDLGYDSFWVAQHRFGHQRGAMPSPLLLLAAIAQRTSRIRLGTASIAAGFEDPRRLVEDAAVLDVLSSGRLLLGLGSGSSPEASAAWGVDHATRHDGFWSAVDSFRTMAADGIGDPALPVVPPTTQLPQRLWITSGSPDGVRATAARGLGLIAGRRRTGPDGSRSEDLRVADLITAYRRDYGPGSRVAISRPIIATDDPGIAIRLRAEELALRRTVDHPNPVNSMSIGDPEYIRNHLATDPALPLADHVLVHTRPLRVDPAVEIASLALIAEHVRTIAGRV